LAKDRNLKSFRRKPKLNLYSKADASFTGLISAIQLEPGQNSETKADNTSVRRFFAKPFVKRISCFCFFGTKNLFNKLFRAKTRSAVNSCIDASP